MVCATAGLCRVDSHSQHGSAGQLSSTRHSSTSSSLSSTPLGDDSLRTLVGSTHGPSHAQPEKRLCGSKIATPEHRHPQPLTSTRTLSKTTADRAMPPREGFTVTHSLFAKVKARVRLHQHHFQPPTPPGGLTNTNSKSSSNNNSSNIGAKHPIEDSASSSDDAGRGSSSKSSSTDVESDSSNANTLSAASAGINSNSKHPGPTTTTTTTTTATATTATTTTKNNVDSSSAHTDRSKDEPSNDSSSTVTDLVQDQEASVVVVAKPRSRKYSLGSKRNSVGPGGPLPPLTTATTFTSVMPTPKQTDDTIHETILSHVVSDDMDADAEVDDDYDDDFEDDDDVFDEEAMDSRDATMLLETVLARKHESAEQIQVSLHELRQLILAYGIPEEPTEQGAPPVQSPLRAKCWKLLLEVHHVSAQEYVSLVKQGKPGEYDKIRNDTFRTLATDKKFLDMVEEDSLIRVLCAFAWSTQATTTQETSVSFTYVQGMNVLAAPFLYAMSEMEAFYSYSNFIKFCCPLYVQPMLQGVHCGIKLLEECLGKIDPELHNYLKSKRLSAEVYAFPSVLTLCACTPPLEEAMQLWDFLLAWGIHLNIICIIAQMYLIRDDLMKQSSPMKMLRIFPELKAVKIIRETIRMIKLLPDGLYDLLVRHPYDPTVADQI